MSVLEGINESLASIARSLAIIATSMGNGAALNVAGQAGGSTTSTPAVTTGTAQQQGAQQQSQTTTSPSNAGVTAQQLEDLIMPHLDNQAIKEALGTAMRAMGINGLPEVQPHQLPDLYTKFADIIKQHTQTPAATSKPLSII